jgi:hypothetical protein
MDTNICKEGRWNLEQPQLSDGLQKTSDVLERVQPKRTPHKNSVLFSVTSKNDLVLAQSLYWKPQFPCHNYLYLWKKRPSKKRITHAKK